MTNRNKGQEFEEKVRTLLELRGYSVGPEIQLGSKKADLILRSSFLGSVRIVCVECKCYFHKLNRNELSVIKAEYDPLYEARKIDELLVVTMEGLTPAAEAMVAECSLLNREMAGVYSSRPLRHRQQINCLVQRRLNTRVDLIRRLGRGKTEGQLFCGS